MPPEHTDPELLTAWLADRDQPCPRCGYNLRGLVLDPVSARCPECDLPIQLRLAQADAPIGPWLLAYTACAMGLGFDSVVLLTLLVMTAVSGGQGADLALLLLMTMMFLLAIGSLIGVLMLLRRRASWARLSKKDRWSRARGVFVGVFLAHLIIGGLITAFVVSVF